MLLKAALCYRGKDVAEQLLKICKAAENKWAGPAITLSAASGLLKQPFHHRPAGCLLTFTDRRFSPQPLTAHRERLGWKRSPGRAGCEMQRAWGESQGCEMGGKVVFQANLSLQGRAGCSSWDSLSHAHHSSVPACIGILLVLVTCLCLASQNHLLPPLALPTRI